MDKPKLLLLHGALGSSAQLKPLMEKLHSHFEVFSYNFPGHGGSKMPQEFRLHHFCEELHTYLKNNQLRGCFVFGYSMGGYVALKLNTLHPGIFKGIATLGTKMEWSKEIALQETKQLNPEKIEEKVPQFAKALALRHQPNNWKEVLHKTADFMMDLGNNSKLSTPDWQKIDAPVQVGIGEMDQMVSLQESKDVVEQLPQGTLKEYAGFKHPIEQIEAEVLVRSLHNYFQSVS
jgi:esterase/lipase